MALTQVLYDLCILRFAARLKAARPKNDRLKIDRLQVASLLREVHLLVENIRDPAAHARSKIPAAFSEHYHHPIRHVLATVIADALHHRGRPRVANRKTLSRNAIEERLAARGSVQRDVTGQDVLFWCKSRISRRMHHQPPSRKTLSHRVRSI